MGHSQETRADKHSMGRYTVGEEQEPEVLAESQDSVQTQGSTSSRIGNPLESTAPIGFSTGAPTRITKMVMHGFKSFGKRTELLFGPQFNVVLGPNGSGKSNILDSLCFVLGKSSSKSLRAEKASNLLYNGGKSKQGAKSGEVSIYFDNSQKSFPTEADTIKVTRIIKDNGQSIYKINDETRTRQQILDLLSISRINPDGYNIILQGDIVRLVEMSTIERRMIIEEIAGIGVYEEKKQKALNELEKVDIKLGEAEIVMKERKTYLKELKKDRDQALKYKELNDKIKQNKASFLKRKIDAKTVERDELQKKIDKETEKLNKLQSKVAKLREDIANRRDEVRQIDEEMERKGEKEQIQIQKDLETLRVDLATKKTKASSLQNEISRIAARKQQLEKNVEDVEGRLKDLNQQHGEQAKRKDHLWAQRKEIEEKLAAFKKKNKIDDESGIEKQIEKLDATIETSQKEIGEMRERQQDLLREKDRVEFTIQSVDERIAKVMEIEKEHETDIRRLKGMKDEFKKATVELNSLLNNDSTLAATMGSMRKRLLEDKERLTMLEARNESIKESIGGNIAISKIIENRSKFGEVYGTVSDLGEVKAKYSLALEIAAGPRIKGIVVKDDLTASKCIHFLKDNKLGTASFLPLNKIKGPDSDPALKKLSDANGVHGLATDLLTYDSKFKNVIQYVFGNTLVVDNIEVARRIGIGKARMVSLDGDLSETSGVMIGGYRQRSKGKGFKEQELTVDIDKLNFSISDMERQLKTMEGEKQEDEKKIQRLRELKANLEGEIIKTEKSLHLDSADLDASKALKDDLKKKAVETDKELRGITDRVNLQNRELANLKIEKEKLRNAIKELKNPIVLAELNAFEQKRGELNNQIITIEADLKNFDTQMSEILKRDKENSGKILKDLDKEESNFKQEIKTLESEIGNYEKAVKAKEAEQAKFYAKSKELYDKRNKLNTEISSTETSVLGVEDESRKIEFRANTMGLEGAKTRAELAGMQAEFEQYSGVELDMTTPEEDLKKQINDFEKMKDSIGSVNLRALEIYDAVEKEFNVLLEKKDTLEIEKKSVLELMAEIEGKKKESFLKSFEGVNNHFKEIFGAITTKGAEASLVLEDPEKPFEQGMSIMVRLSGTKFLDLRSLSGGEKTLTALAFLFAIQEHEPANFYVLDEVDAALDKENSEKLAKLLRRYCDKAQYIVISHNDAVISEGDHLFGVAMDEHGVSKVTSLRV